MIQIYADGVYLHIIERNRFLPSFLFHERWEVALCSIVCALLYNAGCSLINKCFLINPEKKFGTDLSCRF